LDLTNGVNGWTGAATVPGGTTAVRFIVQAVDLAGNVAVSSNKGFGFSNPVVQVPPVVPAAPTALVAIPGNAKLTLTWTAPAANGGAPITDYIVTYRANGGTPITFDDGVKSTTGAIITGLVNGTTYTVTVAAKNSAGTGTAVSTTATPRTVPGAPTALAATAYHSTVALTWAAPTATGASPITDYVVQYRRTTSTTWLTFKDAVSTTRAAKVTGLVDGVAYSFRVAAKNVAGTSAVSAAVTARPTAVPGPITVTATPGLRRVTLAWTAPPAGATAVTDYVVQFRRSTSSTWLTFADGLSTTRGTTVTGLSTGVRYAFRVAARNRTGTGPWSAAATAVPR
ncbi:MAG: hypothetical protein RJA49_2863, partial [Actinomycetota bacterium]